MSVRLDKWLWAARFYKSRQLAVKAIKTGKIRVNQQSVAKPAHALQVNDHLALKRGPYRMEIVIDALSEQRGSATVAQTLYHETQSSIDAREALKKKLAAQPRPSTDRRKPDSRAVREQRAFKRKH